MVAYALLFQAFVIYVGLLDGEPVAAGAFLCVALLQVGRAFLLLPLLVLLSIPVPVPKDAYEAIPMWFAMLYLGIPLAAPLMALGMGARALWDWRQSQAVA